MAKKKSTKNKNSVKKSAVQNSKAASITESINTEVIAEALSTANQPVLLKLCRLCEAKDGPFLNIFEADKVIAKKIEHLMPFVIEEHDDLPHKICFRCSAKVEELYEFVQKCIKTQENLRKAVGKMIPLPTKTKTRRVWEEKLNKSNMSNDDICNALIQKAMEGIKDIPLNPSPPEKGDKSILKEDIKDDNKEKNTPIPDKTARTDKGREPEPKKVVDSGKITEFSSAKQGKPEKADESIKKTTRTSTIFEPLLEGLRSKKVKQVDNQVDDTSTAEKLDRGVKRKAAFQSEEKPEPEKQEQQEEPAKEDKKPFDIMDHISMIKVNGVGILFQCKLCNRNFLKKDVVMSHSCAKNGGPKQELIPDYVPPVVPKIPTVKYINTKTDSLHPKPAVKNEKPIILDDEPEAPVLPKPKPKAGPASKVNRDNTVNKSSESSSVQVKVNISPSTSVTTPTVQFPAIPSINSRYKLVPGPSNTFTLVEEKVADNAEYVSSDDSNSENTKVYKDKKKGDSKSKLGESSKTNKPPGNLTKGKSVEETNKESSQPYPVGLIKKVSHHSNDYTPPVTDAVSFTTPAMKKQSYTIVQTGNPSKLLISTKPQPVQEEVPKKKVKRSRQDEKGNTSDQPFSVTLEDAAPPKDEGFFTFINVDPLLQPSYVLPTHNIIQESQISTSTPLNNSKAAVANKEKAKDKDNNKYACNMCGENFSREKKLLTHIQSHYSKMDEEDQLREKTVKKRGKKS